MKGKTNVAIGLLAIGFCGLLPVAQLRADTSKPHTVAEKERRMTATISSIDKDKRKVTVTNAAGEKNTLDVPEDMKGFDSLKVGDRVDVGYYESVAVAVQRPGEAKPMRETHESTSTAPGGGRVHVEQTSVTAEIVSVDAKQHQVTIRDPEGETRTITVQDPTLREKLPTLKGGETVEMVYTQAVAGSIEPSKKK